jgi:ribosomal protein S18 acetylase RimI-like enzyme
MALEQKCFTDAYPLSRRQLRHLQRSRSAIFVVAAREAAEGSTIVGEGIALLRRHPGRDGGQRLSGRIYTLAVDPSERGKGTGRRLLEVLLDELRQRGVGRVFLEVAEDNGPAIALYDCYGFVDIGKLPDYYAPSRHARHMVKVLEPAVGLRRGMRVQNP